VCFEVFPIRNSTESFISIPIHILLYISLFCCRDNAKDMLETLNKAEVPVLVLSAGIGDLVEEVLRHQSVDLPNVKVISNFMEFDEKEDVVGFKHPLMYV
jgi:2-hydroxy-3-keto-5-methylthiopentenyl-1-phosphate phosphatase